MKSQTASPLLIDNLPIAVVEIDQSLQILQMNAVARQIFPFRVGAVFSFDDLKPQVEDSSESLAACIHTALRRKQPVHDLIVSLELGLTDPVDWFQMNAEPLFQEGHVSLILSFVNVNRRKEQDNLLAKQKAQLLETARHIGINILAGGLAHEINNPLAILRGYTDIVRGKVAKGIVKPEEIEKDLYWIEKNIQRISHIINTLQQFAQESAKPEYESRDLQSIIGGALIFCKERMQRHNITMRVQEIPESIVVDCKWAEVAQAVYNILLNAYDALAGFPIAEKWIAISYRDMGEFIEVDITDNGPGIAPDVAEQMLLPFYTTKPPGSGMGLGLTVANDYLTSHHGYLKFQAGSPHTRFTIGLPKRRCHLISA